MKIMGEFDSKLAEYEANLKALKAAGLEAIEAAKADGFTTELIDVGYGERLSPDQVAAYLVDCDPDGDGASWDELIDSDWEADARHWGVRYAADELLHGSGFKFDDLDDEFPELAEELRDYLCDADRSNPLKQLVAGTGSMLFQIDLGEEVDAELEGDDLDGIREVLSRLGVPVNFPNVQGLSSMIANQGDYMRNLILGVYLDVEDAGRLQRHGGRITDPQLVIMDSWNGACGFERIEGAFTVAPGKVALDSEQGYGSIDGICGVIESSFSADVRINEPEPAAA